MGVKKKILFLYAKNPAEVYNRKSAIGSYFKELSHSLEADFDISINGDFEKKIGHEEPSKKSFFVRDLLRNFFDYLRLKEIVQFNNQVRKHNRLFQHLENNQYDLIFEIYTVYSDVGARLAEKHKIPLVVLFDGPAIEEHEFFNGNLIFTKNIAEKAEASTLSTSQSIVVYSDAVKQHICSKHQLEDNKFRFHQNVDFSRFEKLPVSEIKTEINFLFLGSFLKWHKAENAILAFKQLEIPSGIECLNLYMVGDGQERERIEKEYGSQNGSRNVVFTGFLDGDELLRIKKTAHIGLMPSTNWYCAPNKLFEYGAAGLKVIGPSTPTTEFVFKDNPHIDLVENGSIEELYKSMQKAVENYESISAEALAYQATILGVHNKDQTKAFYKQLFSSDKI